MHFKGVTNQTEETENATSNQNHDGVTDPLQTAQALRSAVVFQSCVIAIGFIGAFANGLVIWVLTRSNFNKDRKASNTFMLNQLFLDLCSCLFLMLSCIWKLAGARLQGRLNVVLCFLIGSENLQWTCINSSIANLVFIALERYVKIVHFIWHRNHYRAWMTYASIAISWSVGILTDFPSTAVSTNWTDGNCEAYSVWSQQDGFGYGVFLFVGNYIVPLIIFIYCYTHIWLTIRKRTKTDITDKKSGKVYRNDIITLDQNQTPGNQVEVKVFSAGHGQNRTYEGSSKVHQKQTTKHNQMTKTNTSGRIQAAAENSSNTGQDQKSIEKSSPGVGHKHGSEDTILKTTLIITILFTVSWCPNNVYFFLLSIHRTGNFSMSSDLWYVCLFVAFLSQCLHPFIYGAELRKVRIYITNAILYRLR